MYRKVDNLELQRLFDRTILDKKYLARALHDLTLPMNARILDIGCGSGGSTLILRECYPDAAIFAVDQSVDAIEYATNYLCEQNVSFFNIDATKMPFPNELFDCCVAKMVFDISTNHIDLLREMVRVLKPQGTLLIYGNTRTTALGSDQLKNATKIINAYKRYVRLTGRRGFDVQYLADVMTSSFNLTVKIQKIIKDIHDPGREALLKFYALTSSEAINSASDNILTKLGLVSIQDVIEYETSLRELLLSSDEYISFEQAIIFATKEGT